MKLLMCKECIDVVSLIRHEKRFCKCGSTGGKYIDDINAIYFGDNAVPIGFANSSLAYAIRNQPENGEGKYFTAFVIPKSCQTFTKVLLHECD